MPQAAQTSNGSNACRIRGRPSMKSVQPRCQRREDSFAVPAARLPAHRACMQLAPAAAAIEFRLSAPIDRRKRPARPLHDRIEPRIERDQSQVQRNDSLHSEIEPTAHQRSIRSAAHTTGPAAANAARRPRRHMNRQGQHLRRAICVLTVIATSTKSPNTSAALAAQAPAQNRASRRDGCRAYAPSASTNRSAPSDHNRVLSYTTCAAIASRIQVGASV